MSKTQKHHTIFNLDDPKEARAYLNAEQIVFIEDVNGRRVYVAKMTNDEMIDYAHQVRESLIQAERKKATSH